MRKYSDKECKDLTEVRCNQCGKSMKVENGILCEGACHLKIHWDYFSDKDGECHSIDLCEECYDLWTRQFTIPKENEDYTEFV